VPFLVKAREMCFHERVLIDGAKLKQTKVQNFYESAHPINQLALDVFIAYPISFQDAI